MQRARASIPHSFTKEGLIDIITQTVKSTGLKDGSVRYFLTAGHGGPEGEFDFVFNTACFYDESNATDEELLEIEMEARAARTTAAIFSGDARSALRPQAVIAAL